MVLETMNYGRVFDGICACGKACLKHELHEINKHVKLCTQCFIESNYYDEPSNNLLINAIPISASSHFEVHPESFTWYPPPPIKKNDLIRICCDDIDEFGELFWCVVVLVNEDGSMIGKINNKIQQKFKQQFGDIIPVLIYPDHVFDFILK
jgi:hypothetical protein